MATLIAWDTEATGSEPGSRLLEIAAQVLSDTGEVTSTFQTLVNPGVKIPSDITNLTGLSRDMLTDAPSPIKAIEQFLDWLPSDGVLCAHNVRADVDLLGYENSRCNGDTIRLHVADTLPCAMALRPKQSCRLQELADHYQFTRDGDPHRALPDADLTRQLINQTRSELGASRFKKLLRPQHRHGDIKHPRIFKPPFECLSKHLSSGEPLRFHYKDRHNNTTERAITLYGYAKTPQGLRFHGWCHLRKQRRVFAAERAQVILD